MNDKEIITKAEIVKILGMGFDDDGNIPACVEDFKAIARRVDKKLRSENEGLKAKMRAAEDATGYNAKLCRKWFDRWEKLKEELSWCEHCEEWCLPKMRELESGVRK